MSSLSSLGLAIGAAILSMGFRLGNAQELIKSAPAGSLSARGSRLPNASELSKARRDVIEKTKETRARLEKLLVLHETERRRRASEYERHREYYSMGLIARNEVLQAKQAWVEATRRVDEDKRWIRETDAAIMEMNIGHVLFSSAGLTAGGGTKTPILLQFDGTSLWTLAGAKMVEKYFAEKFGRALPISALGQTPTHDRLGLDHRDAMDVALHPDSREGQGLLGYLRQAGIPFLAFRNAVPGAATGAHIHIGKPSARF